MKNVNLEGISEAMFCELILPLKDFQNMSTKKLLSLVDNSLQEESTTLFFIKNLDDVSVSGNKIEIKSDKREEIKVSDSDVYLIFWEQLEGQNIAIEDYKEKIDSLKIGGQKYPFFETEEITSFTDYEFFNGKKSVEYYFTNESFGQIESKQLYIYDSKLNEYNIDLINDDVEEELEAIKEMIA